MDTVDGVATVALYQADKYFVASYISAEFQSVTTKTTDCLRSHSF